MKNILSWDANSPVVAMFWARTPPAERARAYAPLEDILRGDLYPALKGRSSFLPPATFVEEQVVMEVVSLERLYRVFER